MEKIKEVREGSHRRTWPHLWRVINNYVMTSNTNSNYDNLSRAYTTGKMGGGVVTAAPAKGSAAKEKKDKKRTEEKKDKKNLKGDKGGRGDPTGNGGGKSKSDGKDKGTSQRSINQAKAMATPTQTARWSKRN